MKLRFLYTLVHSNAYVTLLCHLVFTSYPKANRTGDTSLPVFYSFAMADILGYSTGSSKHALPMKSFLSLTTELLRMQTFVED